MMTLTIDGYGSLSRPVAADQATAIAGLDAFGLHRDAHDSSSGSAGMLEMYFDEISYTR